jgi:hypothetical protein
MWCHREKGKDHVQSNHRFNRRTHFTQRRSFREQTVSEDYFTTTRILRMKVRYILISGRWPVNCLYVIVRYQSNYSDFDRSSSIWLFLKICLSQYVRQLREVYNLVSDQIKFSDRRSCLRHVSGWYKFLQVSSKWICRYFWQLFVTPESAWKDL